MMRVLIGCELSGLAAAMAQQWGGRKLNDHLD